MKTDTPVPTGARAILTLGVHTARAVQKDRVIGLGGEVAFFALLSLPPGLLALLGGIGFVAERIGPRTVLRLEERILELSGTFLTPDTVAQVVAPAVESLLREGRADVISIGVIVAVWSASRATKVLMEAVSIAYGEPAIERGVRRRLVAVGITLAGMVGLAIVIPLLVAGPRLGEALTGPLGVDELVAAVWRVLYWPVVAVLGVLMITSFYHVSPPRGTPWRREVPGAVLALVLWLAGGAVIRLYALWTLEGDTVYGPLAAPIVILLWLFVSGLALLVGAEMNAEIERLWPARTEEESNGEPESAASEDEPRREADMQATGLVDEGSEEGRPLS